jgi:hypothetical protein
MGIEEDEEVHTMGMHNIFNKIITENFQNLEKSMPIQVHEIIYKGKPIKITADFSTEILKERRPWGEVFWVLNENNFNPRILYPAKLSFKINGAIKVFHHKQKIKQYVTTKPPLQKILQGILHTESETQHNHERAGSTKLQAKKKQENREVPVPRLLRRSKHE